MRVLDILRPPLVAIDTGTAMTRMCFDSGRIVENPSVVRETVGEDVVARPVMRGGVVTDIAGVASLLERLLRERRPAWRRPGAVVCVPTDATEEERDALVEAVAAAGASAVAVVPEPLAAAVGAGVELSSEYATAIVDIGEGVTDIAVFRNGSMVFSAANRIGCGSLRDAVGDWIEVRHGSSSRAEDAIEKLVRGYCSTHDSRRHGPLPWLPSVPDLGREDIEALIEPVIDEIASFVARTFVALPDALAAEVFESRIHLTGGGANLDRLAARIEQEVRLPMLRADQPMDAVIRGAGAMLRNRSILLATQVN